MDVDPRIDLSACGLLLQAFHSPQTTFFSLLSFVPRVLLCPPVCAHVSWLRALGVSYRHYAPPNALSTRNDPLCMKVENPLRAAPLLLASGWVMEDL
jgi:hypothetical protein